VTTAEPDAAALIRSASLHGLSRAAWTRYAPGSRGDYDVLLAGYKYNMMDVQAALGLSQLARLADMHATRTRIWMRYDEAFRALPVTRPAPVAPGDVHARHLYTIRIEPSRAGLTREDVEDRLHARGIATSRHFRALHLHSFYQRRFDLARGLFPVAERISDSTLSLPLSPGMGRAAVDRVIEAVHDCFH
jgi:dTDP-4-amino-4,6-dideoxygalactose transaminase